MPRRIGFQNTAEVSQGWATTLVRSPDRRRVDQGPRKILWASAFTYSYNSGLMEVNRVDLIPRINPQSNHSQTAPFSLIIIKRKYTMPKKRSLRNKRRSCIPSQFLHCIYFPHLDTSGSNALGVDGRTQTCTWNNNRLIIHLLHWS